MANAVNILIKAKDEASGTIEGIGKKAGLAFAGAGLAAGAFATVSAKSFVEFEQQMNEVFTLLPGISDEAMGKMEGQVKDFSREFGTLPKEVIPALYQAISAGVPQNNVFDFLETAQKAAKGGVTDLETAVDGISSVVNAYGSDVLSAAEASDMMFTAVKLGKTDFDQLSKSLFNVAPIASSLGVDFGDVSAALAALTAKGVPTSVAATQIRSALTEMGKEGTLASKAFSEMAGQTFPEFIAEGGDLAGALDIMAQAAEGSDKSLLDMFSSVEAGQAALALHGNEAFTDALVEMGNSAGATDAAFQQMDSGIGASMEKIKANFEVLKIEVGEKLAPAIAAAMDFIVQKAIPALAQLGDVFQRDIKPKIEEFISIAKPALQEFGQIAAEQFQKFARYYQSDIKPAVDNIAAAIQWVVGQIRTHWPQIETIVRPVVDQFVNIVSTAVGLVKGALKIIIDLLGGDFAGAWETAKGMVKLVADSFVESMRNGAELIMGLVGLFKKAGIEIIQGLWDAAADKLRDHVIPWFKELPGKAVAAFGNALSILKNIGIDIIQGLWNGLQQKWGEVSGWIGGLGGKIQNLKGPIEKDRVLLEPQGAAIMEGLGTGMVAGWEKYVVPELEQAVIEMLQTGATIGAISKFIADETGANLKSVIPAVMEYRNAWTATADSVVADVARIGAALGGGNGYGVSVGGEQWGDYMRPVGDRTSYADAKTGTSGSDPSWNVIRYRTNTSVRGNSRTGSGHPWRDRYGTTEGITVNVYASGYIQDVDALAVDVERAMSRTL